MDAEPMPTYTDDDGRVWTYAGWLSEQVLTPGKLENVYTTPSAGWIRHRIGDAIFATEVCASASEQKVNMAPVNWTHVARYV